MAFSLSNTGQVWYSDDHCIIDSQIQNIFAVNYFLSNLKDVLKEISYNPQFFIYFLLSF